MFDLIGIKITLVFRAINLGHVYLIVTTKPCNVIVAYLLSDEKSVVMQAVFKPVVFENSD